MGSTNRMKLKEYFGWDVYVWGRSLLLWNSALVDVDCSGKLAIEIAANKGGLSTYLFDKGFKVICTDVVIPDRDVQENHRNNNISVRYENQDARKFTYPNNHADVIIFKSFLGYLSKDDQVLALSEIYRVLKPGGKLLFAENLKATRLHTYARSKFVPWGTTWNYVRYDEVSTLFGKFDKLETDSFGFLSLFIPWPWLKCGAYYVDRLIHSVLPPSTQYVLIGVAVK